MTKYVKLYMTTTQAEALDRLLREIPYPTTLPVWKQKAIFRTRALIINALEAMAE